MGGNNIYRYHCEYDSAANHKLILSMYVGTEGLIEIAEKTRKRFPSFGGVILWDAYNNGPIDAVLKNAFRYGNRCDGNFNYPL
ncbi:uncharacterized protein B0P05DRAFT_592693 [Gilbertella persicaria]|uniref:uncharacterized protein n=1 Tax=Gilbertella persicaria TaxID=101096 RepID=UPI00222045F3|nr:uncharacterized protein B0P05DRAFT_592693 [Gilbertella persicaria]KAI8047352.1 hypothetical protein B0P05DRAFT_592693 [Gilbertella persicaria]